MKIRREFRTRGKIELDDTGSPDFATVDLFLEHDWAVLAKADGKMLNNFVEEFPLKDGEKVEVIVRAIEE